jgi:hypothetical protein
MKKSAKWPRPKKRSDFLVVPRPKTDLDILKDASFGDFNGPLTEQDGGKGDEAPCPSQDEDD